MPANNSSIEQTVQFDSLDTIYKHLNKSTVFICFIISAYLLFTWSRFEIFKIAIMASTLILAFTLRFRQLSAYNKELNAIVHLRKWQIVLQQISLGLGISLGLTAYFLYPLNDTVFQIAYFSAFMMIVFEAASTYKCQTRVFQLSVFPIYIGLVAALLQQFTTFTILMSFAISIFVLLIHRHVKQFDAMHLQLATTQLSHQQLIKRLEKQNKKLIKTNQEKSYFIASANHDIRQPVHTLNLFIDALEQQTLSTQNHNIIVNMKKSLLVLKNYLLGMLDMARLDAQTIEIQRIPINLKTLLAEIQLNFSALATENNINFKTRAVNKIAHLDNTIINIVLAHLLNNAFKFSRNKKVLLTAKITKNHVRFQVIDNGKGISLSDQTTIFDDFKQIENEAIAKQGLGLGLSISKKMLSLLSGNIQVHSTLGKGSCFTVTMPLKKNNIELPTQPKQKNLSLKSLSNKHILVIDDDKMILDAMACILNIWGCQVSLATDYDSTLLVLNKTIPDIIITDYRLENDDGLNVIKQLNIYWGKTVNALIITGDTSAEKLKLFNENNISIYHKPLQSEQLFSVLSALIK